MLIFVMFVQTAEEGDHFNAIVQKLPVNTVGYARGQCEHVEEKCPCGFHDVFHVQVIVQQINVEVVQRCSNRVLIT